MHKASFERGVDGNNRIVFISSRRIDLCEMEQILERHESVSSATVKSVHDNARDMLLKAFVKLNRGYAPSNELKRELAWHVGTDIGEISLFKDIEFEDPVLRPESDHTIVQKSEDSEVHISGHRINLREVEGALRDYYGVREAVVFGVPDVKRGEIIKAIVTLEEGCVPTNDLKKELAWYVQTKIGPMVVFRDVEFRGVLPEESERAFQSSASSIIPSDNDGASKSGMIIVDEVDESGDAMLVSSHWISTTEVTMALLKHPDVADAAVVTVPDDKKGETMKAFIKLKEGITPSNDIKLELAWHVMTDLRPVGVFKSMEIDDSGQRPPAYSKESVEKEEYFISDRTVLSVDVENVLAEHDSVMATAVIGIPDGAHGEVLQAFVVLADGVDPSEELKEELAWHARTRIGPEVVFKSIKFRKFLPKKQRGMLKSLLWADSMDVPARISIKVVD